jgi:hypothetical protein
MVHGLFDYRKRGGSLPGLFGNEWWHDVVGAADANSKRHFSGTDRRSGFRGPKELKVQLGARKIGI